MLNIKNLKIKGFRGYTEVKEFSFETPIILLFGENHHGKSSTLNAIEWCLFGDDCIGTETGIRERKDWEIRNRYMPLNDEVFVELELEDENNNVFKILRRLISKTKDKLEITLPDGEILKDKDAKEKIAQILKSSFKDFLTTVYQHQEAIRAILTQEPKDRNDAIDRLLGLSDYRNILSGMKSAEIDKGFKNLNEKFQSFKDKIEIALNTLKRYLEDKRNELIEKGIKENWLSEVGVLEVADSLKNELSKFALDTGLTLSDLSIPENWNELKIKFLDIVDNEIKRFRLEMPDEKKRNDLFSKKYKLKSLYLEYVEKNEKLKTMKEEIDKFIREFGNEEQLNNSKSEKEKQITLKEKKMKEINAKGKIINEAIDYLKIEGIDKNVCPVCGNEKPDLLGHLKEEWDKEYKEQMEELKGEINNLKKDLENVEKYLNQLKKFDNDFKKVTNEIADVKKKISEQLNRDITEKDDPMVILNMQLGVIDEELEKLAQSVSLKQKRLEELNSKREQLQKIFEFLNSEEKIKIVEQVKQTDEFKQMEELKDKMAMLVNDLSKISNCINKASLEDASNKITLAGEKINDLFCRITENPSVNQIKLSLNPNSQTGKNEYEFTDQNGKDLTPILSQGDLNTLALSIFLGLSYSLNSSFGFIMLDDPSQSLGYKHKEKLIGILDNISEKRTIILSTMDKELQDLASSKLTKAKTKYIFVDWNTESGPEIRKEE